MNGFLAEQHLYRYQLTWSIPESNQGSNKDLVSTDKSFFLFLVFFLKFLTFALIQI